MFQVTGEMIETMGTITFCLLLITAALGLSNWKLNVSFIRPWHHFLAAGATILSAGIHITLVLLAG